MDSFPKIYSLFKELYGELNTLKDELQNDVRYSSSHAEIISFVESAEETLREVEDQIQNIETDIDNLNETLEQKSFDDPDDIDDDREQRMYNPDDDDE